MHMRATQQWQPEPLLPTPLTREGLDLVQHGPHLGHHILAGILNHSVPRRAQRGVQHRAVLHRERSQGMQALGGWSPNAERGW